MKLLRALALSFPLVALSTLHAPDAEACGACLIQQGESTQVTSHRMILSVSNVSTTLWDQIEYAGEPSSFAWVLPIKGQVQVGLSSDALFENLETLTSVQISSPTINCPPPNCPSAPNAGGPVGSSSGDGGVTVIAQEVVGPYETVQLSSQDPNALKSWLTKYGYAIPQDIAPIIDAYVKEGFDFLALKLVPGQGVDSMRPVRVTSPGASPNLPLRMVAGGTGATTPITLFIFGEGRYEPTNFASFLIQPKELVWDWDTQSSNYKELRQSRFEASDGKAWLVERSGQFSKWDLEYPLNSLVDFDPKNSGYGDPVGTDAKDNLTQDLSALFGTIPEQGLWVTRIYGELSRAALVSDLSLGAADSQEEVPRWLQAQQAVGTPPACPEPFPCSPDGNNPNSPEEPDWEPRESCAMGGSAGVPATLGLVVAASALAFVRRRRR
ncbi:DUF2330 domain-containing protein [Polyangium aurulentum]|uniref:DUF2330 domain-containing protein n=1 Tax=Polyangium aurulentum TaxID=2567896 RepID=UPI0010ADEAAA|nr:DUF2330 domain-containing protein [Polyangium aurulentum]UQA62510.1 DUF2330 domain-containing protein [Polyangium aurulentum]